MNVVVIAWSMAAATALTLALIHGLVFCFDRKHRDSLLLAVFALGVGCLAPTELGMMYAQSTAEYGEWARWFHIPAYVSIIGLVLFVHFHFGTGRAWMAWTIIGIRAFVLIANFVVEPNFNWQQIVSIQQMNFLGESVTVIEQAVVRRPWQWLPTASIVLLVFYIVDASIQLWRNGDREQRRVAAVLGGGLSIAIASMALQTQMVVWGLMKMPVLLSPQLLVATIVITVELSRALLTSRNAQLESAELRRELAHAGRVNMLGQLAPTLAHELSQPLSAILRNVETADMLLQTPQPDLEELRAIIADIHRDDLRASDVIDRMRMLLRRRALESSPVAVTDLVEDVMSLVHADAVARRVSIQNEVPAGLPPVEGERVQLFQVLLNLVVNGLDAASANDKLRHVTITARQIKDQIELAVTDSGTGISTEVMNRLFSPFFTTKAAGLGLGLSVSRTIVEAHGGRLWAENNAATGATFRFVLPVTAQALS